MRHIVTGLVFVVLTASVIATPAAANISEYLLPNGEPIVGVYYYPWYRGEPYQKVGWTPSSRTTTSAMRRTSTMCCER